MHLCTSTYPSMHLPTPLHTPLCTSAHPFVTSVHLNTPLCTPLQTYAFLYAFKNTTVYLCPHLCTPCAPPCTSTHSCMHLCAPCIPLCTLCSFVHFHQPLHSPICAPLHTSIYLCAPPCTPVHKSHWIRELPQPIRSLVLNNLINIKC